MITALLTFVITALIFFVLYLYDCWTREKIEKADRREQRMSVFAQI